MGNNKKTVIPVKCSKDEVKELQKKLDSGEVEYEYEVCKSIYTADKEEHTSIIDSWLETYGSKSDLIKNQLKTARNSKERAMKDTIVGEYKNGKEVTVVVLWFSDVDVKKKEKTYFEMSSVVKLNSNTAADSVRKHPKALAALVLSGESDESDECILKITEK